MSKVEVCDLCDKPIMQGFLDIAYKVKVKRMRPYYDAACGIPGMDKVKLDICPVCMKKIIKGVNHAKSTRA